MSTLSFPVSPNSGDTYTFGTKTWVFNGVAWKLQTAGAINNIPIGNAIPSTGAFTNLSAASITGGAVSITGNIQAGNLAVSYVTGTLLTPAQPNITSIGTLTGLTTSGTVVANALSIANNAVIGGNLTISGNVSILGNISSVTGNSAQFFGNTTTGFGALYAGILSGYLSEPQATLQSTANYNGYAGILNGQNINSGQEASTDIFLSADNGTYVDGFLDMGIASSTYNYSGYNLLAANDGYLYVAGNATTGGGNLVLGTYLNNDIVFATGGLDTVNQVMRITSANVVNVMSTVISTSSSTGALVVSGGVGIGGNVNIGGKISTAGNVVANVFVGNGAGLTSLVGSAVTGTVANATYAVNAGTVTTNAQPNITSVGALSSVTVTGNAVAGNLLTTGQLSATGNITGNNFLMYGNGNILGNLNVQGNITFIDSNVIVTNDLYIDLANNQSTYANINGAGFNVGNTGSAPLVRWTYNTAANAWTTNVGISATGNITANTGSFFIGNGSQLTGITANSIVGSYSNANVIALGESGWAGNIIPAGNGVYDLGSETNTWRTLYLSANTLNIGGGNLSVSNGNLLFNGNVVTVQQGTTGNIVANNISLAGNAVASYFVGDGSYLTNINAGNITGGYGNANVYQFLQSGNSVSISTTGNISTAGNVIGNNLIAKNSVNWSNNGAPAVYQLYNASTGSLDTIFV
jgi:hypothetical protein